MQQFSKEKNIPIRSFIGDETKNSFGLNGPEAIADDIDTIINMFDPESSIDVINEDGTVTQIPGGLDEKNLKPRLLGKIEQAYEFTKKDRFFGLIINDDIIVNTTVSFAGIYAEYSAGKDVQCSVLREAEHCESISRITGIRFLDIESEIIVPCSFRFDFGFPDGRSYVLIVSDPNYSEQEIVFANTTVYEWAMQPKKPTYTASEVGAYTKDETEKFVEKIAGSTESILYEDVVNTPEWSNQPTIEGALDTAINTEDFYYVTLKDSSGADLPAGQFMLKDTRATDATIYSTVFSLPDLATGEETLVENYPVEFTESGKMRSAGVWRAQYTLTDWLLKGSTGSVKITTIGEFIQRTNGAMFTSVFTANNNVSYYHSAHNTASQSDATKQIISYAPLSGKNYKVNRFYDESVLQRNGDETYTVKRKGFLKYISEGETGYTVTPYDAFGFGDILTDTKLSSVSAQVSGNKNYGFIRNGTIIRVSEVV